MVTGNVMFYRYGLSLLVTGLATARSFQSAAKAKGEVPSTASSTLIDIDTAWFAVGVLATLYSWYWDVFMDW